ncbi:hypothetical protein M9H77_24845 [Catharanthus roseus]|uniref:Uncharacterized protein n=1 Tax=Catharanthus roseus TaxID=4058 RepID=A0ACC0A595_CATRO|nr:hypothetical protein M9H77_24845 [Catharanthus roseus]
MDSIGAVDRISPDLFFDVSYWLVEPFSDLDDFLDVEFKSEKTCAGVESWFSFLAMDDDVSWRLMIAFKAWSTFLMAYLSDVCGNHRDRINSIQSWARGSKTLPSSQFHNDDDQGYFCSSTPLTVKELALNRGESVPLYSFRCCVICEVPDDEAEAVVYELPHQFHILRWESLKILGFAASRAAGGRIVLLSSILSSIEDSKRPKLKVAACAP